MISLWDKKEERIFIKFKRYNKRKGYLLNLRGIDYYKIKKVEKYYKTYIL